MWTATGSTATVAPQRVALPRPAPLQLGRSRSCCDRVAPTGRSDTHETLSAAPAGRTTRRNRPRSPPMDPQPADTPHEPPAPHPLNPTPTVQRGRAMKGYEGDKLPLVFRAGNSPAKSGE